MTQTFRLTFGPHGLLLSWVAPPLSLILSRFSLCVLTIVGSVGPSAVTYGVNMGAVGLRFSHAGVVVPLNANGRVGFPSSSTLAELLKDAAAGQAALAHYMAASYWKWHGGSRLHFWRWPTSFG